MISTGLSSWQAENGFRLENDVVYGAYNGIGFAVVCEDGGKLFTFMLSGSDQAYDSIEDLLAAQTGRLRDVQVGDVENYLALFFEENGVEMPGQLMTSLLDFVLANARGCGFAAPRVCVKCGAPANKRSFYNDMVQPMCASCSEEERLKKRAAAKKAKQAEPAAPARPEPSRDQRPETDSLLPARSSYNPDEDDTYDQYGPSTPSQKKAPAPKRESAPAAVPLTFADDTADDGSTGKGILGAILGSVAGLIPVTVSVLLGLELTFLCAAAGIGAVMGYIAFGGIRRKTNGLTITFVCAEVLSIAAFIGLNVIAGMSDGASFGEAFSTSVFAEPVDYINAIIAVICAALGIFISLDKLADYITSGKRRSRR